MFIERLKAARKAANLSQSAIAKKLFISQQAYAKYETGAASPNPETLAKISTILNISPDFLLGCDDEQAKKEIAALSDDDLNFEIIKLLSDFTPETRDLALQILRTLKDHEE